MKFILGKKLGMSRIFDKKGNSVPVTLVEAGPCVVVQVKTVEKDGYEAVQIGFGAAKKISRPLKGHLKGLGNFRYLKEFRLKKPVFKAGDKIDVSAFETGELLKARGISKGKGYAGVMKRHGFKGGPASHGQKHSARERGSSGARFPEHVVKGMPMPGRMGQNHVTVEDLEIMAIDKDKNILAVKGAIPGKKDALVELETM